MNKRQRKKGICACAERLARITIKAWNAVGLTRAERDERLARFEAAVANIRAPK